MSQLFRETFAGRLLNLLSGDRILSPPSCGPPSPKKRPSPPHRSSTYSSRRTTDSTEMEILEKGKTGHLIDWESPEDPENPMNWSNPKKYWVTFCVCWLTFSIYIGSAIYTPGIEGITTEFGVSSVVATLGLSLFVFGYGLGPMFLAPFTEAPPIGRMPIYILTLLIFVLFNFGVVYAENIGMLLAFRFLTGFFGSPVLATGGASLADMWRPKARPYAMCVFGNFAVMGPVCGPLVAGFAAESMGWKWTIWELIWLNGFTFVLLVFTFPETGAENILYRKAVRVRKLTGNSEYRSASEIEVESTPAKDLLFMALVRPFTLCFTEPILLAQNLYLGLIYAVLYCWFEAFPLAFGGVYHWSLGIQGLAYLGILVGSLIVTPIYFWMVWKYQGPKADEDGNVPPEVRLPPAIVGSICLPICLFWFGWSARAGVHWIVPIIGSSLFSIGAALLFNAIINYQSDAYPRYVGSVLAGNDFARSAMGGAFPIFASAMFNKLGLDWGCSLLGFLSIAFIPLPILIWRYGYKLRSASKMARHDI